MAMKPEHRAQMLTDTREAAAALYEDIQYLREVQRTSEITRGLLRRLSSVLRRLLVDRDITLVAAPRIGRFMFSAQDLKPIIKSAAKEPPAFFAAGGGIVMGVEVQALRVRPGTRVPQDGFEPDRRVEVRLDGFMSQPVLWYKEHRISRRATIQYVANVASGVHSDTPETPEEQILSRIRGLLTYRRLSGGLGIHFNTDAIFGVTDPDFSYSPDAIDPLLVQILATNHLILGSPDTVRLEEAIRAELGLVPSPP